jgi:DnaJ-class molecular chaperone
MTFEELQSALRELDLPDQVSWGRIRERYHELVRQYHPDAGAACDNERIRRINAAYEILAAYVADYRFRFTREEYLEQYPEEKLRQQFYEADLWSAKDS